MPNISLIDRKTKKVKILFNSTDNVTDKGIIRTLYSLYLILLI